MKVLIDLCIVPIGVGVSLSPYIAACQKVLSDAGLETTLHSYGTNVAGSGMRCSRRLSAAMRWCTTWERRGSPRPSRWEPGRTGSRPWRTR